MNIFPERCCLTWNSKKDWYVDYHKNKSNNDINYIASINLREIGKTISISANIKNNYCQVVKNDVVPKKIYQSPLLKSNLPPKLSINSFKKISKGSMSLEYETIL